MQTLKKMSLVQLLQTEISLFLNEIYKKKIIYKIKEFGFKLDRLNKRHGVWSFRESFVYFFLFNFKKVQFNLKQIR